MRRATARDRTSDNASATSATTIDRITSRGLSSCNRAIEKPSRSSTPVRKFSTSTSACRTSRVSTAAPAGSFRSSVIDSLFRLQDRK